MKKISIFVLLLTLVQFTFAAGPMDNQSLSLTVGAGVRVFSESKFEEVYEGSTLTYNLDIAYKVWNSLELFVHTDYLSRTDGKLTFTQETSSFKLFPLELGARFFLQMKKAKKQRIYPYLGAGAGMYSIKEENAISNLSESRVGFFFEGGLRVYITNSIFFDAKLKNILLKSGDDIDVGGFNYMGGIGIAF